MRKILFFAIALITSATMMAAGGDGSSKPEAIHFDWDGANTVEANTTIWYRLGLSDLSERANDPVIALYLNNLTAEQAEVNLSACASFKMEFLGQKIEQEFSIEPKNYKIKGDGHDIWTLPTTFDLTEQVSSNKLLQKIIKDPANVSLLELCGYGVQVYLEVKTDKKIDIATSIYEKEEIIDDACTEAKDFTWEGETVAAGEKWFYLNLAAVKSSNQKLNFVVTNNTTATAAVAFDLYLDCPASAIALDYDWTIAAGDEKSEALGRFLLNQISEDYVYLKLTTDQEITLKAVPEALPVVDPVLFDATGAETLGDKLSINNEQKVRKVLVADLKAPKGYKTVCHVINNATVDATLKQEVSMTAVAMESTTDVKKPLTVAAGTKTTIDIPSKMLANINSDVVYFRFSTDGPLTIMIEKVPVETPSKPTIVAPACDESYVFDWNSSIKQSAFTTKWYEFDIAPLKQNNEQVHLTFTNHSDSMVVVLGSILTDCQSQDTIPYVLPIPAGKSISQLINYNLIAASPLEKIYVSATIVPTTITGLKELTSISNRADLENLISLDPSVEVEIVATKSSALVDPTLCDAHETLQQGVRYTQAAGTTKWYRVTEDFIKNELGLVSSFTIENQGSAAANITLGATIACDYGVLSRTTLSIPTWFDLTTLLPSGLYYLIDRVTNKDITEFYVEVTTDQPIEFGYGISIEQQFGCDNATEFDWTTGTTIAPNDAKWYKFDITDLKANEQQVKLTFTNTADSLAWVAAFVTYECPFRVGLPMVFPVPAGVSVDKWIDYSFIASAPTNDLYIAVYTDTPLEINSITESAVITPVTDCVNATVVEPNVQYTILPGTHWYKFSAEPFINTTDTHARLSFANKSGKTAHVTTGATVGCEYGILTRGKLPIPQMDVDVNVPLWVFGLMSKFVDEDVDQYYLEVTTDEELGFMIEVAMPCPDPTYVADTTVVYICSGTDYVNPYTGATLTFAHDTVLVDTVATEDICLFNVHVVNLTAMQAPEAMTDATLNLIGAVPALTQGLLPDTTGTITAIKNYYNTNDTETVSDVVNVSWTDVTVPVACDATVHALTLVVEDACGEEYTATFNFPVLAAPVVAPDTVYEYVCLGTEFEDPYTGIKTTIFEQTVTIIDTIPTAIPCVDSVIVFVVAPVVAPEMMTDSILNLINAAPVLTPGYQPDTTGTLTKIWDYYKNNDTDTIADVLDLSWVDADIPVACDATIHTLTLQVKDACGNEIPMFISLPVVANTTTETETVTSCEAYTWLQNGMTYTTSGIYRDTVASTITGCDSVYHVLNLTVNGPATTQTTDTTICSGDSFTWHGQLVDDSQLLYRDTARYASGCDSVYYVLNLTINTQIETPFIELDTICATETYVWHGQTVDATELSYYDTVRYVGSGCDSAYYELHLTVYNVTLPTITEDDIIAICGNAIDVTVADSIILAHIASDPLYAAVTSVTWEVNINGTWTALTSDAIDGTVTSVSVRYTIQTTCENVTSEPIVVTVETPTPENDEEMTNIGLYYRYGDRLLTIDLKQIQDEFGWVVAESDVTWYYIADGATPVEVGHGYYLTTVDGKPLMAGKYYARINHTRATADDCDGILQTITHLVGAPASTPKLAPTIVKPQELISLLNLNAESISTVSVYSTMGELITSFQVSNQEQLTFPAAQQTGYYVVDVQTETEKVSLRYIVK